MMPKTKFHLSKYTTKQDVYLQIEELVDMLISNKEKELNLCFNISKEQFDISKEEHDELILKLNYDELIKLTAGIYRNILEKKSIKEYQSKIISQQLKLSKDITPTYLKHRLPEMFIIKNTKEMIEKFSDYNFIYIGYKIYIDEFTFTEHKLDDKDYIYLFKVSKRELVKIIQVDLFTNISVSIW